MASPTSVSSTHRLSYISDLLNVLVGRDIKLRYKRSVLGLAWSLVNPLAQFVILNFVFHTVLPLDIPNYTPFLFTGVLAWNWFHTSLVLATSAIVENGDLIRRPGFPPAILPLISVISNLVHFLIALPILVTFVIGAHIHISPALLWLPAIIALEFLVILSPAYFLATIQVTFRDTQYLLVIFLMLGFYLTPVFYDSSTVAARYAWLYAINPMVYVIDAYRAVLLRGEVPDLRVFALIAAVTSATLLVGYRFFMRASYRFAEEL